MTQIRLTGGPFDGLAISVPETPSEITVPKNVPVPRAARPAAWPSPPHVCLGVCRYRATGRTDRDGAALYTYAGC